MSTMADDGHFIDDPLSIIKAKHDFSDMGLTIETIRKQAEIHQLGRMLYGIELAISIYGENRSLGNVAQNIRAILQEKRQTCRKSPL